MLSNVVTVFIPKIIYFNLNITKTLQSVIFSSLKCQEYQEVLHHIAIQERKDEQKKKELDRFFPPPCFGDFNHEQFLSSSLAKYLNPIEFEKVTNFNKMCAKPSLKIKYVYTLVQAGLKRVLKNRLILVFRRLLDQVNLILMTLATNIPSNRNDNTRNEESLAGSSQSDQDESLSSAGT